MDKFSFEANGYNRSEVNNFIQTVIVETEKLLNKVDEQKQEIQELRKELNYYKRVEDTLVNTINKAEETSENIKRISREESELIISKAKNNASRIINEALLSTEKLENDKNILEKNITILKGKLKVILEQQKVVLDALEELDSKN